MAAQLVKWFPLLNLILRHLRYGGISEGMAMDEGIRRCALNSDWSFHQLVISLIKYPACGVCQRAEPKGQLTVMKGFCQLSVLAAAHVRAPAAETAELVRRLCLCRWICRPAYTAYPLHTHLHTAAYTGHQPPLSSSLKSSQIELFWPRRG